MSKRKSLPNLRQLTDGFGGLFGTPQEPPQKSFMPKEPKASLENVVSPLSLVSEPVEEVVSPEESVSEVLVPHIDNSFMDEAMDGEEAQAAEVASPDEEEPSVATLDSGDLETPSPAAPTAHADVVAKLILPRHALHAAALTFTHPFTKVRLEFNSPLPEDLQRFFDSQM